MTIRRRLTLLLCKIVDFCKVYWSPRFVGLSPFVRQFAMYRPQYWSDRSDFVPADVFWSQDDGKILIKIGSLDNFFAMETNRSMMRDRDFSLFWYFISRLLVDISL